MLLVLVLVPFTGWSALGFPTDNLALGALTSSVIAGVICFAKLSVKKNGGGKKQKKAANRAKEPV